MNSENELRRYVIRRFVTTLILVGVAEYFLLAFINNLMLPQVITSFLPELSGFKLMSLGNLILALIVVLIYSLTLMLTRMIPAGAAFIMNFIVELINTYTVDQGDALKALSGQQLAILVCTLMAVLILVVLPVAAGALLFSRQVTREFAKLEVIHDQERKDNERKRYLMISDIAHDLKTPMTTVSGYARALSDGMVKEEQKQEYLEAITSKTERMNDIVQMLFDYVRLDSEGFELVKSEVDVCELVRECASSLYQDIEEKGDELEIDIPEEPIMIKADNVQFRRVINNLISNAIKHNEPGTVIGISVVSEEDDLRIYVADSGKAIGEELKDGIFDPFVMGDESRSTRGGSGLGLSIVRKITELHGYKIKLVQKPEMARYRLDQRYNKVFVIILGPQVV